MRTYAQKPTATQQPTSALATNPGRVLSEKGPGVRSAFQLQRSDKTEDLKEGSVAGIAPGLGHDFSRIPVYAGGPSPIQAKLKIGAPEDKYEQEADRVANQVMRMPEPQVQQQATAKGKAKGLVQTKANPHGGGQSLPASTRAFFEPRFGEDFGEVRVHDDLAAHKAAGSIGARAFTYGNRVVFGRGAYAPHATTGLQLIAHELTHVVQSRSPSADSGRVVSIKARLPIDRIAMKSVPVNDALRDRVEKCVKPFYYNPKGKWDWIGKAPNCSDIKIPVDRKRAWRCLDSMYWSKDGTRWTWPFDKEPKCDDLILPAPIEQIRGETPAETKTRKAKEEAARKEAERIAREDAHNLKRIAQIKKATPTDVDALAQMFTDSKIKDDGTVVGRFTVIFRATKHWLIPGLQTGIEFGFSGFKKKFHDPWPSSSNQVGHFLTAVRLAMDSSVIDIIMLTILNAWFDSDVALRLIIGHEKKADPSWLDMSAGFREQYESTTKADIKNFKKGDLKKIKVGKGKGNSMADLDLSHKGWLLGRMVVEGKMKSNQEVSKWLLSVLK